METPQLNDMNLLDCFNITMHEVPKNEGERVQKYMYTMKIAYDDCYYKCISELQEIPRKDAIKLVQKFVGATNHAIRISSDKK